MALLQHNGRQLVPVPLARWDSESAAILCCPGPSLSKVNPSALKVPGITTFAMNTAYPYIRPDYWVGMDEPECYDRRLWFESFPKVIRASYGDRLVFGRELHSLPNVWIATLREHNHPYGEIFRSRGTNDPFVWSRNTFFTALNLIIWLGFRTIYLAGCDFGGEADYHYGNRFTESDRVRQRHFYRTLLSRLPLVRFYGSRFGTDIVSVTEGSILNQFIPHVPLDRVLEGSARRFPDTLTNLPVCNSRNVTTDPNPNSWGVQTVPGTGVIVASDASQEDLLPFWWHKYRRHNKLPVCFMDIGMTQRMADWCAARGIYKHIGSPYARPWFAKPMACLQTPFERTIWMDTDCEVLGDIEPMGDLVSEHGLALAQDEWQVCKRKRSWWQSGLFVYQHGHPLFTDWALATVKQAGTVRGDQDILNKLYDDKKYPCTEIPATYTKVGCNVADIKDYQKIIHWAGVDGKMYMRHVIREENLA